mgnify:CR=1 FL=1
MTRGTITEKLINICEILFWTKLFSIVLSSVVQFLNRQTCKDKSSIRISIKYIIILNEKLAFHNELDVYFRKFSCKRVKTAWKKLAYEGIWLYLLLNCPYLYDDDAEFSIRLFRIEWSINSLADVFLSDLALIWKVTRTKNLNII